MAGRKGQQTINKRNRERAVEEKRRLRRELKQAKREPPETATPCCPSQPTMPSNSPAQKNYGEIERLEKLLAKMRSSPSTARETEAIREIGLEIAIAIREVGAMLVNVGWEQSFATTGRGRED
jgi:hypothetical protein